MMLASAKGDRRGSRDWRFEDSIKIVGNSRFVNSLALGGLLAVQKGCSV